MNLFQSLFIGTLMVKLFRLDLNFHKNITIFAIFSLIMPTSVDYENILFIKYSPLISIDLDTGDTGSEHIIPLMNVYSHCSMM